MTIDLTQIILAIITLIFGLITRYLIPWIKAHTDSTKLYALMRWAKEAVYAAEQIYGGKTGKTKKQYAAQFLYKIAKAKGINITEDELNLLIEAAVGSMNIDGFLPAVLEEKTAE